MKSNKSKRRCLIIMSMVCMALCPLGLEAQDKHALLIGISDYPQYSDNDASWPVIHGANDIQLIKSILQKQGFSISTLMDNAATYKSIIKNLASLKNKVNRGDIVYIHFSGHGQVVEDESGDEEDDWDEAFIPYDAQRRYKVTSVS